MAELTAIESWVGALLAKLSPAQRTAVARKTGQALRRSQSKRITAQKDPDGSPYKPRAKPKRIRNKAGGIRRRAMFAKLKTARFMKVEASADEVGVGFLGRAARIAKRHQEGSSRKVYGRLRTTPKRELLGLSDEDLDLVRSTLLDHLTK